VLRSALCENAATILGKACRRNPDWFKDESLLLPKRKILYNKWLSTGLERDRGTFINMRRNV